MKGHTLDEQKKYRIEENSDDDEIESLEENSSDNDLDEVIEEGSLNSDEQRSLMKDSIHALRVPTQKLRGQSDCIQTTELDPKANGGPRRGSKSELAKEDKEDDLDFKSLKKMFKPD